MKHSIALMLALSLVALGCGDDDSSTNNTTPNNANNVNNTNNQVDPPIDLPAVAALASGTGGSTDDAYLCEMATEGGGFEFTLESGANASPCEGGLIYINFQYDGAEQFYEAQAGATLSTGEETDVRFESASMGTINERETNEPDRLEGIPEGTETTLATESWSITFTLTQDNVTVSNFQQSS